MPPDSTEELSVERTYDRSDVEFVGSDADVEGVVDIGGVAIKGESDKTSEPSMHNTNQFRDVWKVDLVANLVSTDLSRDRHTNSPLETLPTSLHLPRYFFR